VPCGLQLSTATASRELRAEPEPAYDGCMLFRKLCTYGLGCKVTGTLSVPAVVLLPAELSGSQVVSLLPGRGFFVVARPELDKDISALLPEWKRQLEARSMAQQQRDGAPAEQVPNLVSSSK